MVHVWFCEIPINCAHFIILHILTFMYCCLSLHIALLCNCLEIVHDWTSWSLRSIYVPAVELVCNYFPLCTCWSRIIAICDRLLRYSLCIILRILLSCVWPRWELNRFSWRLGDFFKGRNQPLKHPDLPLLITLLLLYSISPHQNNCDVST